MSDRALVYIRKSVVRYEQDRASPERQLANCIAACEQKGWQYEVYEDAEGHRSGRSEKDRPAWRGLKASLGRPAVSALVVNSLDRAARSPSDFLNFLVLVQEHDVELVSLPDVGLQPLDAVTVTDSRPAGLLRAVPGAGDYGDQRGYEAATGVQARDNPRRSLAREARLGNMPAPGMSAGA